MLKVDKLESKAKKGNKTRHDRKYVWMLRLLGAVVARCKHPNFTHIVHQSLERCPHTKPHSKHQSTDDDGTVEPYS